MKQKYIITLLLGIGTIIGFNSCSPKATSTIVGGDFNFKTNETEYFVFPLGSISMPGQWKKTNYNSNSRQQWFMNSDSVSVAIAFGPCDKYEFHTKQLKDYAFVKAYYDWDSKYLTDSHNLQSTVLLADSINNFIVWRLFGKKVDNYFLFGYDRCSVHNYTITTSKLTEEQKIKFLRDIYIAKK